VAVAHILRRFRVPPDGLASLYLVTLVFGPSQGGIGWNLLTISVMTVLPWKSRRPMPAAA